MPHDLVIRGGTVVDGTGAPARSPTSRSTATGIVSESAPSTIAADRELDADGRLVTPGFVDIHTHLDAQLAWDPTASSSCWHGVTTIVVGNCGVTFAPVRRRRPRVPRRDDGVGRGHPEGEHPRRPPVGLGGLRRLPRLARAHPEGRARGRDGRSLRRPLLRDGRPRRSTPTQTPTARRARHDARARRRRAARRARSASRRRARCATACPTAATCPAPGPTADELLALRRAWSGPAACSRSRPASTATARRNRASRTSSRGWRP